MIEVPPPSPVARRVRTARQDWAAPGGSHDRFVAIARVGLPTAIGVLAAFLVMAPLTAGGDVSFLLDKNKVDVAQERMKIQATDGPANIKANTGRYDMDTEKVQLFGPLNATAAGGYDLKTTNATIDMKARTLESGGAATGTVQQGTFSANKLRANLEERTVTLDGNARLRIIPRGPK
jgi:lipopolysaccharide export system protein LptC